MGGMINPGKAAKKQAAQQEAKTAADEAARQAQITSGTETVNRAFAGYDPAWYQKRQKSYLDWADPQLEDQYENAREQLIYALARQYGTLETSEAAKRQANLAAKKALAKTQIAENAAGYSLQAKRNIEAERSALLGQVQAASDPAAIANTALKQAQLASSPPEFSSLGALFEGATEGLAGATYPYGITGYSPYGTSSRSSGSAVKYVT